MQMIKDTTARRVFIACNTAFLILVTALCITPLIHLLAVSFSHNMYASAGVIGLWPRGFATSAYSFLWEKSAFMNSMLVSLRRVLLGVSINMSLCLLTAYPLSRERDQFHARTVYVWIYAVTMFFGGGLVPTYLVVNMTGIGNSIWALVLPGALNVWHMVMMLNFFRSIPKSLEEAARLDGASHFKTLLYIYLPLSLPSLATILLFTAVGHWNSWFDGFLYINHPHNYPLQTYLSTLIINPGLLSTTAFLSAEEIERLSSINAKTLRTAQIFLGALPIMCVYPFLQRYFIKGIVLGSVKE
jgi:putative aldouronate transport system permease protein